MRRLIFFKGDYFLMKKLINIDGKSQYDDDIDKRFRPSACGPVTAFILMKYLFPHARSYKVNELYEELGGTKIGLFKRRFIRNMQRLLGPNWHVAQCTVDEAKQQIDDGRPVAAKFDRWFTGRWRGQYAFDYHWVPVIGYEEQKDDLTLIIHDNGSPNRPSEVRYISYKENRSILTFVKIEPVG